MNQKRTTIAIASWWVFSWLDWTAWKLLPSWCDAIGLLTGACMALWWLRRARSLARLARMMVASAAFFPLWQGLVVLAKATRLGELASVLSLLGTLAVFLAGLAWVVWLVETRTTRDDEPPISGRPRIWNPLHLSAWYYGAKSPRLKQSAGAFLSYSVIFGLVMVFLTQMHGCRESYEMPAGGGKPKRMAQVVQIQKVVKRKYVINPFSAVVFNPPPLDDVKLQIREVTAHRYSVGYGEDPGAGFRGGTARGKVRLIRLDYSGGDWDQDMGVGSDLNMLVEYGVRTGQPVNDVTESRRIAQLENFPIGQSPPFLYITGQRGIEVNDSEVKTLTKYLLEKHGMLFADNGGSAAWHTQFFALMQRVLPTVQPIRVPLDHPVHRAPYEIPFLPYVAPHGGRDAWGWVVEGRLVCYYHPGDIGDAWADGHAGVKREIWEYCYQLGTNVIFYAHSEYSKWLASRSSSSSP